MVTSVGCSFSGSRCRMRATYFGSGCHGNPTTPVSQSHCRNGARVKEQRRVWNKDRFKETEMPSSEQERELTQIQYLAWPDHGVPDDSTDFLDFVALVRTKRAGQDHPMVVHCSAGIGRTGVLITMETALCLMECGQPVYPLDIVRTMRDQRAMMIQTPSQYRFVCEAILRVYEEGLVKPLKTSVYRQREKANDQSEEERAEQQRAEEETEDGEAPAVELLEGGLDEEDDDDEEVEVLDVGEVTEDGEEEEEDGEEEEEEEEEVEEPSVASAASATSATSETSVNPDPDPDPDPANL